MDRRNQYTERLAPVSAANARGSQPASRMRRATAGDGRPVRLSAALALALAAGASALPAQGAPLRLSGLRAGEPLQAAPAQPQLDGQRMLLPLGSAGALRIQPWPMELPAQLGPQQLRGELRPLPAGPMAWLEFTREGEDQAWLVLGSGTRSGQPLWGGWRLQLAQGRWSARRGPEHLALASGAPVLLQAEGRQWCFYLLDARVPPSAQWAALHEREAQADWAMQRLQDAAQTCEATPGSRSEIQQK
ncbi:hypothetical protein [Comamonas sp. NLF-1-9]|uniref:hypothetical protein n=1 Tax=Comamonas sp. NLF-1-9 TaxID=2853163 RepID=UPI001C456043|nr:hypothetical protein [Comamonas sp. NLF-1-9]QXL84818.1 hypothetical protein KUD94_02145 [Comamonas sp. NLF-1-9]